MQQKSEASDKHDTASTSRSLLQHLHANDQQAWDRFVLLYTPLVWQWCRRMNLPLQESADVLQEVFQSVALHFTTFHRDRPGDTLRGWLRTITRNKVRDHYRKQLNQVRGVGGTEAKVWLSVIPEAYSNHEEELMDNDGDQSFFRQALELIEGSFEETTWKAFWGVVVEGRHPQDVADELKLSAGAVRVAKCRVLQRLRQELGDFHR